MGFGQGVTSSRQSVNTFRSYSSLYKIRDNTCHKVFDCFVIEEAKDKLCHANVPKALQFLCHLLGIASDEVLARITLHLRWVFRDTRGPKIGQRNL